MQLNYELHRKEEKNQKRCEIMEAQQETEKGLVADAIAAAKELRAANAERLLLLEREERLHAERVLSGSAHAGARSTRTIATV